MSAPPVRHRPTTPDTVRRRRPARTGRLDVRIGATGLEAVDQRATAEGLVRSEATRRLLAYAVAHMPAGWHPGRGRQVSGTGHPTPTRQEPRP